jgi:hypothetical protein
MYNIGIFFGHLEHFTAICLFYNHLGNFVAIWYIFPRFGILCQEKSGTPIRHLFVFILFLKIIYAEKNQKNLFSSFVRIC